MWMVVGGKERGRGQAALPHHRDVTLTFSSTTRHIGRECQDDQSQCRKWCLFPFIPLPPFIQLLQTLHCSSDLSKHFPSNPLQRPHRHID